VARSETYTLRVARKLGYPLVIKPLEGNHGRGITTDIKTEQEALDAFRVAKSHSREIIVEQYITGFDHRMVVVNGELVAVAKRVPGHVIGDGKHTIKELIDIVNSDPRRGVGHEKVLTRLELDRQAYSAMQHKGYNENTVLDKNETLYLRETANLSTGGTAIDVTDLVHPDNKDMAVRAVLGIGLDVGGVDFLTDDISKSYKDVGGGICEVNAAPGFRMHVAPSEGEPRDVAGSVIDSLFPEENDNARIPICSITGTNGKTTTSRMLSHIYKSCGYHVGLTTTDGIYIDGRLAVSGDTTGPKSAQVVLKDPTVDIAVMETARGGLVRNGMGYDYCDVGAVLNVESDHLGLKGIDTLEQLARVKRIVTDAARDTAVFNADDPKTLKMAPHTDAKHIFYVTMNPQHMLVREHIRSGGKAAIIEKGINGDMITIFDNHRHIPVLWTHLIPATMEGKAIHNVQNAMFSIAIAYSVGVKLDDIRNGMRTFSTSFFQAPGRMNIFEEHPFKVLMDYAHNPSAVSMIAKLVSQLEIKGRRICVLSSPGDRRDEDVVEMAKAAAGYFDYYICREDDNRRGRSVGEISHIQAETLKEAGVSSEYIERINDEFEAVQGALEIAEAGDYVCIFADNIKRTWKQIIYYNGEDKQQEKTIEPKPQHISVADMSQDDSVSEEISELLQGNIISDERGVRVSFQEDEDSD
jgi:cyanophycin synthetase